jgi:hypothetical protein
MFQPNAIVAGCGSDSLGGSNYSSFLSVTHISPSVRSGELSAVVTSICHPQRHSPLSRSRESSTIMYVAHRFLGVSSTLRSLQ